MTRPELTAHQALGVEWITRHGRGLLGDEPGMGKTRIAIEAFDRPDTRVLVVAPAMVITGGTWENELARWANHPESFTVVPYTSLNVREKTGKTKSSTRPVKKLKPEYAGEYDAVILDEAHYIKGRATSWTWAVQRISRKAGKLLAMTGTPVPNWAHEMFTLLQVVYPDRAVPGGELGSYWRWVETWFQVTPSYFHEGNDIGGLIACTPACRRRPANDPCEHYWRFMEVNFRGKFLRRLRKDCLDLPEVTTQTIQCPMSATQKRAYNSMKKDYLAELEGGAEVVAWTDGAKNVALDRITTTPWLLQQEGDPRGGKLERLKFDLSSRSNPTVVFAHYRDTVDACVVVARSLGARAAGVHGGVDKRRAGQYIKQFKEGKLDVLVGSLETLAEGQQLTVADMLILVEVSFKPSRNEQARMRVDRMGQVNPVTILDYVTPGTVDERKRKLLAEKTDHQMRVMSAGDFASLV